MELWVRLQNRYRLLKVEDIIVSEDNVCCDNEKGRLILGTYKNEERALEVLDEIQYNIKNIGKCDLTDDGIIFYTNIYEMPEE